MKSQKVSIFESIYSNSHVRHKKSLKLEYLKFKKFVLKNRLTESNVILREGLIPSFLKDKVNFIKQISQQLKVDIGGLFKLFLNKGVFTLFSKLKWSIKSLFEIVKKGYDLYKQLFLLWGKFVKENRFTKGIIENVSEKIRIVNEFFDRHPNLKKVSGVVVAGLLVYIWLTGSMVGHKDIDFDISTIIDALLGKFDLVDIFLSEAGIIMLTNFIIGLTVGLTFPYPGSDLVKFTFAIFYTLAKKLKIHLESKTS